MNNFRNFAVWVIIALLLVALFNSSRPSDRISIKEFRNLYDSGAIDTSRSQGGSRTR